MRPVTSPEAVSIHKERRVLFQFLFASSAVSGVNHFQPANAQDFFENFTVPQMPEAPQPKGLVPKLLPFQRRALNWMLRRESPIPPTGIPAAGAGSHPLWERITLSSGDHMLINRIAGAMTTEVATLEQEDVLGGILAEEMGLGKTVEIIALVCAHPWTSSATPPATGEELSLLPCKTTLIVSPASIVFQWVSELEQHAPDLKVCVYEGIKVKDVTPEELSAFDVVLTTYEVLRKEVHYAQDEESTRQLRAPRKYHLPKSPLAKLQFWRVCLDEAQMVESTTANAAEMAQKLRAVNRWAVTGTPIGRNGIEDLYGLLLFLDKQPWSDHFWWRHLTELPDREELLLKLLQGLLWRSRKRDVLEEIRLPPQEEETIFLNFSPIESANYKM